MNSPTITGHQFRVETGDPEWVADLFDTFRAGDLDVAVANLDALVGTLRRAAKARGVLTTVQPRLLRQGLEISACRRRTGQ